jgi:hypothetical protein
MVTEDFMAKDKANGTQRSDRVLERRSLEVIAKASEIHQ